VKKFIIYILKKFILIDPKEPPTNKKEKKLTDNENEKNILFNLHSIVIGSKKIYYRILKN